jgi:hypothetical protein
MTSSDARTWSAGKSASDHPRDLRAFADFFIAMPAPCYGPHFAYLVANSCLSLTSPIGKLFALVLSALDHIQAQLENPFGPSGQDNVMINVETFMNHSRPIRLTSSPLRPQLGSADPVLIIKLFGFCGEHRRLALPSAKIAP